MTIRTSSNNEPQAEGGAKNSVAGGKELGDDDTTEHVAKSPSLVEGNPSWTDDDSSEEENVIIQEEPLKYKRDLTVVDETDAPKRQKTCQKRCEFNEVVRVVPIPMRTEYSTRVRQRIWSNSFEIQQNAARNTLEFASEGWDWRSVILDESMFICDKTGDLIHPIHYEPYSLVLFEQHNNDEPVPTNTAAEPL